MTDEAHPSAQPTRSEAPPRLSFALGDGRRPQGAGRAPREGPQEAVCLRQITERRDFLAANAGKRVPMPGFVLLRSEEHTSELQSIMRTSYAVFCWKKKKTADTLINRT